MINISIQGKFIGWFDFYFLTSRIVFEYYKPGRLDVNQNATVIDLVDTTVYSN